VTRDYKPAPQKKKPAGNGSPFLIGMLVGLLLGIGASVGVALFVKDGGNPFVAKVTSSPNASTAANTPASEHSPSAEAAVPGVKSPAKPRFDFYTILPGSEKQVTEQEIKQAQTSKQEADKTSGENYFLQVGAFQTEQEADNMKAKLALLGLEAVIQTATIPDKGVWHRVRVGPFVQIDDINKARTELVKNNIDSTLLKIHGNTPDQ
jgi:cell division protein FtsN